MATLSAPKVQLKLTPVPKTVLYAQLSGELLSNTGMKEPEQIRAIQQAASEGLLSKVVVIAKHPDGNFETIDLHFKPFAAAESIHLELEQHKSYLESLDVSLAAAVQYAGDMIKRQGLTPTFQVEWSERAKATPGVIAEAIKRLNLKNAPKPVVAPPASLLPPDVYVPPFYSPSTLPPQRYPQTVKTYTAPPAPPAGMVLKPVLSITPAKDPGVTLTIASTRKV